MGEAVDSQDQEIPQAPGGKNALCMAFDWLGKGAKTVPSEGKAETNGRGVQSDGGYVKCRHCL